MKKTMADRVTALEADLRAAHSNSRLLAQAVRDINAQLAASKREQDEERIDPGSLSQFTGPYRANRQGQVPDLATPLIDRLRDDASILTFEGRSVPFEGTGNLLLDPALETNYTTLVSLSPSGSYTALGEHWSVRWESTSGLDADEVDVFPSPTARITSDGTLPSNSSSANVNVTIRWGAPASGGVVTFYLHSRTASAYTPVGYPQSEFMVASVRLAVQPNVSGVDASEALAWMEVTDDTDTVLATGDTIDLNQVAAESTFPIIHAGLTAPDLTGATTFLWRLAVQVTTVADAGQVTLNLIINEPSLSLADEDAPQSFQPAVGAWTPYFLRSINLQNELVLRPEWQGVGADHNDYTFTGWQDHTLIVLDPGASSRNITGFEAPTTGIEGTTKVIHNAATNGTSNIVLKHDSGSSSAANRIYGNNDADVTIRPHGGVVICWLSDGDGSTHLRWRVLSER